MVKPFFLIAILFKKFIMARNRRIFYTSDIHFDDNRLNLYGRDLIFANEKEFNQYVIEKWNSVVGKEDLVIVVGDVSMTREGLEYLLLLNGEKWLVKGNYDNSKKNGGTAKYDISDDILFRYFEKVMDDYVTIVDGEKVYVNHYPTNAKPSMFNIVGHIHGTWKVQRNMVNVGLDAWHFTPVSEELIKFQMNGIRNHYDQNVFAGELNANTLMRKGEIKVLHAPEYANTTYFDDSKDVVVFLAGPIQGAPNWQDKLIEKVKTKLEKTVFDKNIFLCSPRRGALEDTFNYDEQVDWESYHLDKASKYGAIVFWIPLEEENVPGRSYAQTTRFEIGEWFAKGQSIKDFNIVVGIDPKFPGCKYIMKRFTDNYSNFVPNKSLSELADNLCEIIISKM